jgi:predicted DNA-binding transcriptional regulator AlpA
MDIMKREFWGTAEIGEFTKKAMPTVYGMVKEKGFPDEAFVLGENTRAWHRTAVIKWWEAKVAKRRLAKRGK